MVRHEIHLDHSGIKEAIAEFIGADSRSVAFHVADATETLPSLISAVVHCEDPRVKGESVPACPDCGSVLTDDYSIYADSGEPTCCNPGNWPVEPVNSTEDP